MYEGITEKESSGFLFPDGIVIRNGRNYTNLANFLTGVIILIGLGIIIAIILTLGYLFINYPIIVWIIGGFSVLAILGILVFQFFTWIWPRKMEE